MRKDAKLFQEFGEALLSAGGVPGGCKERQSVRVEEADKLTGTQVFKPE